MIQKFLPASIKKRIQDFRNSYMSPFFIKSYSQEGEDMILRRIFENKLTGAYVDVGAFHPKRYSNTYLFYKLGWRGINIDPNPETHDLFNRVRHEDINVLSAVHTKAGMKTYYMFKEPAYNTLDSEKAIEYQTNTVLLREIQVECKPLAEILYNRISKDEEIDFLNIDVEGLDIEVLESNNWEIFRPNIIVVEQFGVLLNDIQSSNIAVFLSNKGYKPIAKTVNSVFYKRS